MLAHGVSQLCGDSAAELVHVPALAAAVGGVRVVGGGAEQQRLPGSRQALHPQRDRLRRRLQQSTQQLCGHSEHAGAAVPAAGHQCCLARLPAVPEGRLLRRERRSEPAQVPRHAEHRRQVR